MSCTPQGKRHDVTRGEGYAGLSEGVVCASTYRLKSSASIIALCFSFIALVTSSPAFSSSSSIPFTPCPIAISASTLSPPTREEGASVRVEVEVEAVGILAPIAAFWISVSWEEILRMSLTKRARAWETGSWSSA